MIMAFLDEVRKKLDLPPAEKEQVMRELESHYHEVEDEALSTGMNECEASAEAAKRLGDPSDIAQRMQTVHTRATWKTALLTSLPFLGIMLIHILAIFNASQGVHRPFDISRALVSALLCTVFILGSIKELRADRRPLWLATWLPIGFTIGLNLISMIFVKYIHITLSHDGYMTQGDNIYVIQMGLRTSIEMLFLGLMSIWIYKKSNKWKSVILGVTIIGLFTNILLAYFIHTHNGNLMNLLYPVRVFFYGIIIMLFATRLFLRHPYGNKIQTSIILYAFLMPGLPMNGISDINLIFWLLIIYAIVSALMILFVARTAQWQVKQWLLCSTIIILTLLGAILSIFVLSTPYDILLLYMSIINALAFVFWIVFIPELIDRYIKKRRPEFVQ